MIRSFLPLCLVLLLAGLALSTPRKAQAQHPYAYQYNRFYYYPYYYFPHNYWPSMGRKWPERPGEPYQRPPVYMAYPPFHEPSWRYELWEHQRFHRGFHFWLDQF